MNALRKSSRNGLGKRQKDLESGVLLPEPEVIWKDSGRGRSRREKHCPVAVHVVREYARPADPVCELEERHEISYSWAISAKLSARQSNKKPCFSSNMKPISRKYNYDDEFFLGKLPPEARYLPDPFHDYPIFIEGSFLSKSDCTTLVEKLIASGPIADAGTGIGTRKSKQYLLPQDDKKTYEQAFLRVKPKIEDFFNATILSSEIAHGLGYKVGDRYDKHSDNCEPILDASGRILRFEYSIPNRQISTLLFLTDSVMDITGKLQCIGGNLSFPFIRDQQNEILIVEPRIGLFVAFPSNPIFVHEVHEVFEGFRMVIVDWHSAIFHKPKMTE